MDAEETSVESFLRRMNEDVSLTDQLQQMAIWLQRIGNSTKGAEEELFRFENKCHALPPKKYKQKKTKIDLRLYCYWVSEKIVILFSGGNKTKNSAQDCPNVRRYFLQAQLWTKELQEIGIEHEGKEIINLNDLYIKC